MLSSPLFWFLLVANVAGIIGCGMGANCMLRHGHLRGRR